MPRQLLQQYFPVLAIIGHKIDSCCVLTLNIANAVPVHNRRGSGARSTVQPYLGEAVEHLRAVAFDQLSTGAQLRKQFWIVHGWPL